jgi:pSer/pThr/pTyr-binding forkhead associated (FHA) protein
MARILLIENGKLKNEIALVDDSIRIGRDRKSHVQLDDATVSRYHAEIFRRGESFFLEDKKSTNGTRLNGKVVTEKVILEDKDKIAIGNAVLVFDKHAVPGAEIHRDVYDSTATVYDLLKHK